MKIGYLMNIYPVTSGTFIRREIQAIERQGVSVARYAVRRWDEALVDPQDQLEQDRTFYLLSGRSGALLRDFGAMLVTRPAALFRALGPWWHLLRNSRRGFVRHVAYLLEAVSLTRRMSADGVSHLHAHWSTNTAAVALLSHRMGGPQFSFTAHGPDEFVDWSESSLKLKVDEADFVVAISHFARVQLVLAAGQGAWPRIHVVGCGLKLDEFTPNDQFADNAPFVCVGRLCPQKAQTLIVAAMAEVVKTHPHARLVLVGDGESRADVEAAVAAHDLSENVALLGWQDNAQVREHLGNARALVLPSFAEGLPVVIMESLALGRPAISSYIAGIPELVDDKAGWLVPAGSVDAIAGAMRAALDTPAASLAAMGAEGRRRVENTHDVDKNAANLIALFRAAAQG